MYSLVFGKHVTKVITQSAAVSRKLASDTQCITKGINNTDDKEPSKRLWL